MKKAAILLSLILAIGVLAGCGNSTSTTTSDKGSNQEESKALKIGATAGPYSDMVTKAIKPIMEKKGYTVEVIEFGDYVQPNLALSNGDLNANLFQHKIYMENFAKENKLQLSELISVPTAPMGIYSSKFKSLDEVAAGSTVAVANDPTNLARTLGLLQDAGLLTIKDDIDPLRVSEKDVKDNPKQLVLQPIEAGQLPRAADSVDLSLVPGNFALAAKMNLLDALKLENMPDDYRNRLVVNTAELDKQFAKDLKEAVESAEFEQIIDEQFKGFGKPEWMLKRK
ncbi:MetQ/NlpA family ABC transporter substrate-binding protein [Paenibacillus sp. MER TA 81-3]|uniref:MetQ/NlpA family ABC transporter substrate-binding protein n=1 Tax=Paenibacillus sp. MER TA 81-3 TaxID=2939573 RepID=UPI00203E56BD|nr:MetQ/NlpA family ABC transporter substrate-binding protein [Paenibacillus sp. MER TA 81-3]MCM3338518.1 MetQ/NlpA family ABC transporter substrate-binding protein [Paenibacillus sp. MER TA 81-3]